MQSLQVTESAKNMLTQALAESAASTEQAIRILPSRENPNSFSLTLDKPQDQDVLIENESGKTVLLIEEDLAPRFESMKLDAEPTPDGARFILSPDVSPDV